MKYRIFPIISLLLLFSCGAESVRRTYHMQNAPFPHPAREAGFTRNEEFFPAELHYRDNRVAVIVPEAYQKETPLELLIHFHGWGNNTDRCIRQFSMAQQVEASGRDILLVVPEGPRDAPDSFFGKLCDEGGFARFVDELLDSLISDDLIDSRDVGGILLSGHSGGYYAIGNILRHGGCTEKIRDVFLFDGLYALEEDYLNWLQEYEGRFVHVYTDSGGTFDNSQDFMKACDSLGLPYVRANTSELKQMPPGRILMLYSDLGHNAVISIRRNLKKLLEKGETGR